MAMRGGLFLGLGVAAGVGIVVLGPVLWRAARPVAKSTIKAAFEGYELSRKAAARMSEEIEDLVAEAVFEMGVAAAASESDADPSHERAPDDRATSSA